MRKTLIASLLAVLTLGAAGTASAVDEQASFSINLDVQSECLISAQDFNSAVGGTRISSEENLTVSVLCNAGTPYSVGIDRGLNDGADPIESDKRALLAVDGSGSSIPYELYRDIGMTLAWGDLDSPDAHTAVGNGLWQNLPARIRLNRLNMATSGAYTDQLVTTVRF